MNYKELREGLGLSKQQVVTMAQRAKMGITPYLLTRLEAGDETKMSAQARQWLEYVYGQVDISQGWDSVEVGAPVFVLPIPKGSFQFKSVEKNGDICVFGGTRSKVKYRWFPQANVRVVSTSLLPEVTEDAPRRIGNAGRENQLLAFVPNTGEVSTRTLAEDLGWDAALVSRVCVALTKEGRLVKVMKGVYRLP